MGTDYPRESDITLDSLSFKAGAGKDGSNAIEATKSRDLLVAHPAEVD